LPILDSTQSQRRITAGENRDDKEEMTIEALTYHIKLLNYFAMQRSLRPNFLDKPILAQLISVLQDDTLINQCERITQNRIEFISQSLTLSHNVELERRITELIVGKNLAETCSE
jgi:flagellar biosynthesis regulator FlaF